MYSVFSQQLIEHWCNVYKAQHRCKDVPTEITPSVKEILMEKPSMIPCVMYCNVISTLDYIAEEATYTYCTKSEVRKVGEWIHKNLVIEMPNMKNRKTVDVKLRIAVDMLNKLEYNGIITKDINLFYFHNIVTNLLDLWVCIHLAQYNELPF